MSDSEQEIWDKPIDGMVNTSKALTRYTTIAAQSGSEESQVLPNQLPQESQQQPELFVSQQANSVMASPYIMADPAFLAAQQMITAQQVMSAQQMMAAPQMRSVTSMPVLKIVELSYADGEKKTALAYDVKNVAVSLTSPGLQGHGAPFIPVGTHAPASMGKHSGSAQAISRLELTRPRFNDLSTRPELRGEQPKPVPRLAGSKIHFTTYNHVLTQI